MNSSLHEQHECSFDDELQNEMTIDFYEFDNENKVILSSLSTEMKHQREREREKGLVRLCCIFFFFFFFFVQQMVLPSSNQSIVKMMMMMMMMINVK
jgi:hypothetical protein